MAKNICEKKVRRNGKKVRCKTEATYSDSLGRNLCEHHYNLEKPKEKPKPIIDESEGNDQYDPYENNYDYGFDSF